MEVNEPRNEYEARRARKEAERRAADQSRRPRAVAKNTLWTVFGIVALALIVWGIVALARSGKPQGEDLSRVVEIQGADHIPVGASHPPYNSNPPTSGPHYGQTARSDFYTEEIPDEYIVHNLEHGQIWIAYHLRIGDAVKNLLKKFRGVKVIISPRSTNSSDIALVAWGRIDTFDLQGGVVPEERISDFIKRYQNKGPEKIPPGAHENTFN